MIRTVVGLHPSCDPSGRKCPLDAGGIGAEKWRRPLVGDRRIDFVVARSLDRRPSLGPFLQLTPTGQLAGTQLDSSPLINSDLVNCGPNARGQGIQVYISFSGAGHPKGLWSGRQRYDGGLPGLPPWSDHFGKRRSCCGV